MQKTEIIKNPCDMVAGSCNLVLYVFEDNSLVYESGYFFAGYLRLLQSSFVIHLYPVIDIIWLI